MRRSELNPTERRKAKTEERYMFDVLFISQRVSTSNFCLNSKYYYITYDMNFRFVPSDPVSFGKLSHFGY